MSGIVDIGIAAAVYVVVVGCIGILAGRRSSRSPEEYFLAGRGLRTAVLFMALFGTNCTSFVLVGIPGLAYDLGIGVFGLNAAIVALGVPLTFWAIGSPARRMGQRLDALTPAELCAKRLASPLVGLVLFGFFTLYTVPYMVQGVKAASLVLSQATGGALEPWLIGIGVMAIVLFYTSLGGMRGTAWTNVLQGTLFLVFMVVACWLVADSLGGFGAAMRNVQAEDEGLLRLRRVGLFEPRKWASWGLVISTTVIAFPHMLVRLMAAKSDDAMRTVCKLYPLALVLLWVPAVLFGVWGRGALPHLGRGDRVFQALAETHLPEALGFFAFLAVLAAVMSTLDAQILTLSSMLVRDVLARLRDSRGGLGEHLQVVTGRAFTLVVAGVVYALSITWGDSVFDISRRAFEGYTTLVPTLLLTVRWRRFNAPGALASLAAGNGVLALGWGMGESFPGLGFLPVFWSFVAASAAGVVVSLATPPEDPARTAAAFGESAPAG